MAPEAREDRDAYDAGAAQPGSLHQSEVGGQALGDQMTAGPAPARQHRAGQSPIEAPLVRHQVRRHPVGPPAGAVEAQIGAIEELAQVSGAGAVVGQHQQPKGVPQTGLIAGEGVAVEPLEAQGCRAVWGQLGVRRRGRVQQQGPVDPALQGVPGRPADGCLEVDLPPVRCQPGQGALEAHREAPAGPLVAVDGGGEHDPRVGPQQPLQEGGRQGRGLVDQEEVAGRSGLHQGVRGEETDLTPPRAQLDPLSRAAGQEVLAMLE